jgi:hypothetical protein
MKDNETLLVGILAREFKDISVNRIVNAVDCLDRLGKRASALATKYCNGEIESEKH